MVCCQHQQRPGRLTTSALRRVLAEFTQLANVEATPHTLRHTFAKRLIDSGVSLEKVAALLGHASLTTTQIYTTPGQADLTLAVEGLE